MSTNTLTRAKAQATLDAVKARYAAYFEPLDMGPGEEPLSPTYTDADGPTLHAPESGPPAAERGWAILWEEGPDDWAYQFCSGGSTETERVLMASAAVEFGVDPATVKPAEPEPGKVPAGVFAEPYASYAVGLYPA